MVRRPRVLFPVSRVQRIVQSRGTVDVLRRDEFNRPVSATGLLRRLPADANAQRTHHNASVFPGKSVSGRQGHRGIGAGGRHRRRRRRRRSRTVRARVPVRRMRYVRRWILSTQRAVFEVWIEIHARHVRRGRRVRHPVRHTPPVARRGDDVQVRHLRAMSLPRRLFTRGWRRRAIQFRMERLPRSHVGSPALLRPSTQSRGDRIGVFHRVRFRSTMEIVNGHARARDFVNVWMRATLRLRLGEVLHQDATLGGGRAHRSTTVGANVAKHLERDSNLVHRRRHRDV